MSADGDIKEVHGALPFIDYWDHNRKFNLGLFQIIFSSNSVGVHDSWTNYLTLKGAGGVVFNNGGIVQSNVFVRELNSGSNACFSLYESDSYKNMSGYIEQYGEQTSMVIPEHTENMNGTFHFDQQAGCLVDMQRTSTTHDEFNMMVRGHSANSQTDFDLDASIKLISP